MAEGHLINDEYLKSGVITDSVQKYLNTTKSAYTDCAIRFNLTSRYQCTQCIYFTLPQTNYKFGTFTLFIKKISYYRLCALAKFVPSHYSCIFESRFHQGAQRAYRRINFRVKFIVARKLKITSVDWIQNENYRPA